MKTSTIVWIVLVVIIILGGWYWLSMSPASQTPVAQTTTTNTQPTTTTTTTTPSPAVLSVHTDPTLGTYLVAANGMTLYTSTADSAGVSKCTGVCSSNWPAYSVSMGTVLTGGSGISGAISMITLASGSMQVTYKGLPLYFWIKDSKPGDATGRGIGSFVLAKP